MADNNAAYLLRSGAIGAREGHRSWGRMHPTQLRGFCTCVGFEFSARYFWRRY